MRRIFVFIAGLLCLMYACNNDLTTIGQEVIGSDNYIGEEDILVTNTATVKPDSFITSCGEYASNYINQMVMGKYVDKYSGTTVAIPCFQVSPASVPSLSNNTYLDSITLEFRYGGNIWGDTVYDPKLQKFSLYQLAEVPELNYDNNTYFYNTEPVRTGRKIGETEFYPLIVNMSKAYFKVDQAVGEDLLERLIYREGEADDIYNVNKEGNITYYNFFRYMKGLAIVPDEENDCMMTIHAQSDSLYLCLYYSVDGNSASLHFPLSLREYQYNRITNKPIPEFESLTNQEQSVSFDSVNLSLTQGLAGYMTKMILPPAPLYGEYTTIVKAQLEIKPEFIYDNPVALPSSIMVYTTNDLNELTGYLSNNSTNNVTGTLVVNDQNTEDTRYIFDMTEYYQNLNNRPPTGLGQQILLSVPNDGYSSTGISFNQMVVTEVPKVKFYYAKYK